MRLNRRQCLWRAFLLNRAGGELASNAGGAAELLQRAFHLYLKSAALGDVGSAWLIGVMLLDGEGVRSNRELALSVLYWAAAHGSYDAARFLSYAHANGAQGLPVDAARARELAMAQARWQGTHRLKLRPLRADLLRAVRRHRRADWPLRRSGD